jgi:hypothetical protein
MEVKIGNRRLKMIDGKVCIVMFSNLGVEVKSGKFTPIKFSDHKSGYRNGGFRIDGRPTLLYEHRLVWKLAHPDWDIFDVSPDNVIDHYNRDRKDNRLENLHVVNNQQNTWNTDAKGYTLTPQGKYKAQIRVDYALKYLGTFDTEEEARSAYLQGKIKYHHIV